VGGRAGAVLIVLAGCGRFGFGDSAPVDAARDGLIDAGSRYEAAVLADHPIGFWRFEPAANLADASPSQLDGVAQGGVSFGDAGLLPSGGASARFDGATGYIDVGNAAALDLTSTLTLEGWIRASSFDHALAGGYPRVLHKGPTGNTGYALMVEVPVGLSTGSLRIELEGPTAAGVTGATVLVADRTYYVAATYDGAFMKVYVDGQVDGVIAAAGPITSYTDPLEIGRRRDSQRYWAGLLDEVAVYPVALTPQQITAHYTARE
jgi:hypothetical protein